MIRRLLACALVALPVAAMGQGGAPASGRLAFDAASIKRNASGGTAMQVRTPPGQFTMTNGTVMTLLSIAHNIRDADRIDAPEWVRTERYDVTARAVGTPTEPQLAGLVRALLEDRFKLAAHLEPRERPIYALRLARDDRRLGPNLRRLDSDCAALGDAASQGKTPPRPELPEGIPLCGVRRTDGTILSGGLSMPMFVQLLTGQAGRVVVDQTGLEGYYAFTLNYAMPPAAGADSAPGDRPSLFTALQEQLGLRLEAQRSPVDILVVDRIERPTAD
jgi:uncharacterized protein (TIGR03435 family)